MSNGRSFSRRRRTSPGKSVRKNAQRERQAEAASLRSQIEKMAKQAGETISSALEATPKDEDVLS
jgi:hypothetical protein